MSTAAGYRYREFAIPDYMVEGLDLWTRFGVLPGDFLIAVLSNDLMEACARADETNLRNLPVYCAYLYNEAPPQCFGSKERVRAWIEFKRAARQEAGYRRGDGGL